MVIHLESRTQTDLGGLGSSHKPGSYASSVGLGMEVGQVYMHVPGMY